MIFRKDLWWVFLLFGVDSKLAMEPLFVRGGKEKPFPFNQSIYIQSGGAGVMILKWLDETWPPYSCFSFFLSFSFLPCFIYRFIALHSHSSYTQPFFFMHTWRISPSSCYIFLIPGLIFYIWWIFLSLFLDMVEEIRLEGNKCIYIYISLVHIPVYERCTVWSGTMIIWTVECLVVYSTLKSGYKQNLSVYMVDIDIDNNKNPLKRMEFWLQCV